MKIIRVRPWAKATAVIPPPAAPPTIEAAPAPMNTSAKVPMNSARSLGASEFDIFDLQEMRRAPASRRDQSRAGERCVGGKARQALPEGPPVGRQSGRVSPPAHAGYVTRQQAVVAESQDCRS